MSQSPLEHEKAGATELGRAYEAGWVVTHRMIRAGYSWSGRERNCMFLNVGDQPFANVSGVSGIDFPDDARAMALCDWDRDGRTDMWVANRSGPRLRLLLNRAPSENSFVALKLEGKTCNRDAIGARVELALAGEKRKWHQTLRCGEGYLAQSSRWMQFGLPQGAVIERASVRWPGGAVEEFQGVAAGKRFVLAQGSGSARAWSGPQSVVALATSEAVAPKETEAARIVLAARPPMPRVVARTATDQEQGLAATGKPLLVILWATWCPPCITELTELAAQAPALAQSGVEIVAVSLDEPAKRGEALDFLLKKIRWPFGVAFGDEELATRLDVLQQALLERDRRLPVPSSFLVDAENRLAVITKGPLSPAVFLADAQRIGAPEAAWRDQAIPFPGRWHLPPPKADLHALASAFEDKGFADSARDYRMSQIARIESSKAKVLFDMGVVRDGQDKVAEAIDLFFQATQLEPGYFDARAALGYALHRSGNLDQAIAAYRDALHLAPAHVATIHNMALALWQNGERDAALAQVQVLQGFDPKAATELATRLQSKN